jgi:hypothetical protein
VSRFFGSCSIAVNALQEEWKNDSFVLKEAILSLRKTQHPPQLSKTPKICPHFSANLPTDVDSLLERLEALGEMGIHNIIL